MRLFSLFYAGPGDSLADYAPFAIYHGTFSDADKARQAAIALLTADLPEDDEEEPQVRKTLGEMLANPEWDRSATGFPRRTKRGRRWWPVANSRRKPGRSVFRGAPNLDRTQGNRDTGAPANP